MRELNKPVVALVGRPNVGKSTLFNRIIGRNLAVVHDRPGVTRDRIYADTIRDDRGFRVVDTGGLDLSWGNHRVLRDLADLIVQRKGFGAVLADGVARASRKIKGSEQFAMHVKGLEMGGYDPRGAKGQGLSFATCTRGGCHHAGGYIIGPEVLASVVDRFTTEGKAQLVKDCRNSRVIYDSAILCTFNTGALGWSLPRQSHRISQHRQSAKTSRSGLLALRYHPGRVDMCQR